MSILVKKHFHIYHKNINDLNENLFFSKKMKGKDNFSFCGSSLNDISLGIFKAKKVWIRLRKVLDSLCSRSCIVPYSFVNFFSGKQENTPPLLQISQRIYCKIIDNFFSFVSFTIFIR